MSRIKKAFIEHPGERVQPVWHELPQDPPTLYGWYLIWHDGHADMDMWTGAFEYKDEITHWALIPFGPNGKRSV